MACHITRFLDVSGQRVAYELSLAGEMRVQSRVGDSRVGDSRVGDSRVGGSSESRGSLRMQALIDSALRWLEVEQDLIRSHPPTLAQCEQLRDCERQFIGEVYKFKGYPGPADSDLALLADALAREHLSIYQCLFQVRYTTIYLAYSVPVKQREKIEAKDFCRDPFDRFRLMLDAQSDELPVSIAALIEEPLGVTFLKDGVAQKA